MFSDIVSRVLTIEVLSTGVARNYNGALQVMTAEFQLPTPLVPTRESHYVRYYKQHADGTWLWLMFRWIIFVLVQHQDVEEGHLDA